MDILPITEKEIISFVAVTVVPTLADVFRVGVFQIALRLKLQKLADFTVTSKFGVFSAMVASFVCGLALYLWIGGGVIELEKLGVISLAILGWATTLYKLGYEKSDVRKSIVSIIDKVGPSSLENDRSEPESTKAVG